MTFLVQDEIVADFGERWFNRIKKIALEGIKRELVFLRNFIARADSKSVGQIFAEIKKTEVTNYG